MNKDTNETCPERTVSKTLIREQKVFATLPFPSGAARRVRFLLAAKLRNEFYPTSSAPPRRTTRSSRRSFTEIVLLGSVRKCERRRPPCTSLRANHLLDGNFCEGGRAENRLVSGSLFLSLRYLFGISSDGECTTRGSLERVETHYSSEEWDILRCSFHISLMNVYKREWMNNVSVI